MSWPAKSCPFCDSANIAQHHNGDLSRPEVVCTDCGAQGPIAETPEAALAAWDRRSQ